MQGEVLPITPKVYEKNQRGCAGVGSVDARRRLQDDTNRAA